MAVVGEHAAINPGSADRRLRLERRRRHVWAVAYGSFNPRRRNTRRSPEHHIQFVDWHDAHLLAIALGIVLLSSIDAFLTLNLLTQGAQEVNPVMEHLLYRNIAMFATVKMALTGLGVMTLVALSRCRVFGKFRVDLGLYLTLAAYAALVFYEFSLLDRTV
jgi:hypothetical protein